MRSSLRHNRTMRAISKTRPLSRNTRGRACVGVYIVLSTALRSSLARILKYCYPKALLCNGFSHILRTNFKYIA